MAPTRADKLTPSLVATLRRALVDWFRRGHRDMPWRQTRDPYAIWVSEIMLQQTRVPAVRAYYQRWMARLPTVRALAAAPLDDVLSLWSGLGYYARARNLKAAAEALVANDGGEVPRDPARIRELPGIGAYTAGAIASIAFGLPEPILDGNVARVLSRLFEIDAEPERADTKARLWSLARALVPADAASDFNQAMMELGATVCTPRAPVCTVCPVQKRCSARRSGRQAELPRKKAKRASPTVEQIALVVRAKDGRVLLGRRPPRGLWGGLWEPLGLPLASPPSDDLTSAATSAASSRFGLKLSAVSLLEHVAHELTHRRYLFHALAARATPAAHAPRDREGGYTELRWVQPDELSTLGLSAWASRLLAAPTRLRRRSAATQQETTR